jgi:uncharacterized protein (DUF4415 family)
MLIRKTLKQMRRAKSRTDWGFVKGLQDADIQNAESDFTGGRLVHTGRLVPRSVGRPKKPITRQLASIRIPSPELSKLRSLGKGWSTIAGDVLADWINKKSAEPFLIRQ